jgi:hypothetical protein
MKHNMRYVCPIHQSVNFNTVFLHLQLSNYKLPVKLRFITASKTISWKYGVLTFQDSKPTQLNTAEPLTRTGTSARINWAAAWGVGKILGAAPFINCLLNDICFCCSFVHVVTINWELSICSVHRYQYDSPRNKEKTVFVMVFQNCVINKYDGILSVFTCFDCGQYVDFVCTAVLPMRWWLKITDTLAQYCDMAYSYLIQPNRQACAERDGQQLLSPNTRKFIKVVGLLFISHEVFFSFL